MGIDFQALFVCIFNANVEYANIKLCPSDMSIRVSRAVKAYRTGHYYIRTAAFLELIFPVHDVSESLRLR